MSAKRRDAKPGLPSAPASPHGVIGAAVVQATRRSAHLTRLRLARQLKVSAATVRSWENGTVPLFSVPYGQLQRLAEVLGRTAPRTVSPVHVTAAATRPENAERFVAIACDLQSGKHGTDLADFGNALVALTSH